MSKFTPCAAHNSKVTRWRHRFTYSVSVRPRPKGHRVRRPDGLSNVGTRKEAARDHRSVCPDTNRTACSDHHRGLLLSGGLHRHCRAVAPTTAAAASRAEIRPIGAHGANGYRQRDPSFAVPDRARHSNEISVILALYPKPAAE
jgi:hypothetical protein